jgi:aquaporin Z
MTRSRVLLAEGLGTALLVFFGAGTATLTFGFKVAGWSLSAGVVATALAFGLVLVVLAYALGPISGCHVNPAVTLGFLVARRIPAAEAVGYWGAQLVGGIAGAAGIYGIVHASAKYRPSMGLGADGYGKASMIGVNAAGAFAAEAVLTFLFVFVILVVTRKAGPGIATGLVIGLSLTLVHLIGIPIDGTSVNPARSLGPALFVGGSALSQLWVFLLAPLVGGALSAVGYHFFYPDGDLATAPAG